MKQNKTKNQNSEEVQLEQLKPFLHSAASERTFFDLIFEEP